jgi:hypothetical protein
VKGPSVEPDGDGREGQGWQNQHVAVERKEQQRSERRSPDIGNDHPDVANGIAAVFVGCAVGQAARQGRDERAGDVGGRDSR